MHNFFITQVKKEEKNKIYPLFLPFFGCPQICSFCNQTLQTATASSHSLLCSHIDTMRALLEIEKENENNKNKEIAFYGGTFSALPEKEFLMCLSFIKEMKDKKFIDFARCSTRPDCCSHERLEMMKTYGIDTIELGIQTFSKASLEATKRNYKAEIAIQACKDIKKNFKLGIQLMPNIPKQSYEDFLQDIEISISLQPDFMRLYPCLVVEDTLLAQQWKNSEHKVWDFETMLSLLSKALYKTWQARIPVIRIGVAYEEDFYTKILAGVRHLHLGQLVQEKALQILIHELSIKQNINTASAGSIHWHFPLSSKGFLNLKKNKDILSTYFISSKNIHWHKEDNVYITQNS